MDRGTGTETLWIRRSATERVAAIDLAGRPLVVILRRNPRARRLILRVAFDSGEVIVTLPPQTPWDHALVFVSSRSGWIAERLDRLPRRVPFGDGARVPVLGLERTVRHDPGQRSGAELVNDELWVGGDAAGIARRVERWLRRCALAEVSGRSRTKAAALGVSVGRISVREVRTRWGSCSADGNLSYSWRLVLAPEFVLDYVVAHEVAHLRVRGHGPDFWTTVADLVGPPAAARQWLQAHGPALHRYGPPARPSDSATGARSTSSARSG